MILHVVLYQPRDSATTEERAKLTAALETACLEIPFIQQVRVGKAVNLGMSYNNRLLSQQFDYVAVLEFRDDVDLKAYLVHDRHRTLADLFWKVCERTMIIDVDAADPLAGESIHKIGQMAQ